MTAEQLVFSVLSDAAVLARAADGVLTDDEQAALRWAPSTPDGQGGEVVGGRRGAHRRGGRADRPAAELRTRGAWTRRRTCRRCSAGRSPVAASTVRSPCSATWPRATAPVGRHRLAGHAHPSRQAGRPAGPADDRLPGARRRGRAGQPPPAGAVRVRPRGCVPAPRRLAATSARSTTWPRRPWPRSASALAHEGSIAVIAADAAVDGLATAFATRADRGRPRH